MTATSPLQAACDFLVAHRDDYATAVAGFQWPRLETFNWALDHFDVIARANDAPALWLVEEDGRELRLSYRELSQRSNQVANHLRTLGVRRGDHILLMLPNHVALWETMLAAIKLGAVVIPATMLLSGSELADRIERGQVRHIVTLASETGKFNELGQDATRISVDGAVDGWQAYEQAYATDTTFHAEGNTLADDPMLLYFTSGTTAKPKLVLHSHSSYPIGHLSTLYWIGLKPGDIHYNISSPGWAKHAWSCFFAPLTIGATVFSYNAARFNAARTLDVIARCGVTTLCAPPTVWRLFVQEDLAAWTMQLRELVGAGEPLNPEIIEQIRDAWGLTIRDGFGQTETTAQIGNPPAQPLKAGAMGRPLPGYRIALLDIDGNQGEEGEISVALPNPAVMLGYQDDPSKTAEVMRDGWYRTGDVASRDADGYYTYVGRADDVFKSSDYRISPFELESALIEHEAVAEAAVIPSPDPLRLSVPKAYVTLARGFEPSAELAASIFAFSRELLGPFKRIRRLEFRELPKTISGKIRRVELRREEVSARAMSERSRDEYLDQDFAGKET